MHDWVYVGGGGIRGLRQIMINVEQTTVSDKLGLAFGAFRRCPALPNSVNQVVRQRVDLASPDMRMLLTIPAAIEQRMRPATLTPAGRVVI